MYISHYCLVRSVFSSASPQILHVSRHNLINYNEWPVCFPSHSWSALSLPNDSEQTRQRTLNYDVRMVHDISKQQNQSPKLSTVRYGFDEIIMDISFPFSRTCLPLLGFPFGITLPLPVLPHNDPFLLEHHPHPTPSPLKLRLVTIPTTGSICSYSHVIFQGYPKIISW